MKDDEFEGKIEAGGEFELHPPFWKRLKEALSSPETSERLVRALGRKKAVDWYDIREYRLDDARDDELVTGFPRDGDIVLVLECENQTEGQTFIKFDSRTSDTFDLAKYRKVRHNFSELYLTNVASPGHTLYVLFGRGNWDVERHYPEEKVYTLNADTVDSLHASASVEAGKLLALGSDGFFPDNAVRNIQHELDANIPSSPVVSDVFIPTDATKLYVCFSAGTWTDITAAASLSFSPAGNIVATDVQAAIEELDTEKIAKNLIDITAPTELTIAAGAITVTQTFHTIDTEADAASDDLDTINGGSAGRAIVIRAENDARTVVVKHNTGNIWLKAKTDLSLDDLQDGLVLIYDGSKWIDLGGPAAGLQNIIEDTTPQLGGDLDVQTKRIYDVKWLDFKAPTELTIATGAITITQSNHIIDTEADAATDDLDTINGGSDGRIVVLKAANDARTVVVKHNTGNIWLQGKADVNLDDLSDGILLVYNATDAKWFDISAGGAGISNLSQLTIDADKDWAAKNITNLNTLTLVGVAPSPPVANRLYKDSIIKAWIQFNGTGTIAIQDSFNVTSITDNGTGNYTVTWDTDFANDDYTVIGLGGAKDGTIGSCRVSLHTVAVGTIGIRVQDYAGAATDYPAICLIAIGDQS